MLDNKPAVEWKFQTLHGMLNYHLHKRHSDRVVFVSQRFRHIQLAVMKTERDSIM